MATAVHPALEKAGPVRQAHTQTVRDIIGIFFLKKGVFTLTFAGVIVGALLLALLSPPSYQTTSELLIKPQFSKPLVFDQDSTRMNVFNEVDDQTINAVIFMITSDEVLREVVVKHQLADANDETQILNQAKALRGRLKAEPLTNSNMVKLTLRGRNPQGVVAQLNTIIETFIRHHIRVNQTTEGRYEFFDNQTQQLQDALIQMNTTLAETSKNLGVIQPENQLNGNLALIREMESSSVQMLTKFNSVEAKLKAFRMALQRFQAQSSLSGLPAETLAQYPALVEMEKSLAQLVINRQRALSDYQPGSKQVQDSISQYANMKEMIRRQMQQIISDLEAESGGYRNSLDALQKRVQTLKAENAELAKNAITIKRIALEHDLLAENYKLYSTKKEEARINREKDRALFANVTVASQPNLPTAPAFPQIKTILMFAVVMGLVLATAVSAAIYAMERKLWTPTDIQLHTKIRYLGSLDALEAGLPQLRHETPSAEAHEGDFWDEQELDDDEPENYQQPSRRSQDAARHTRPRTAPDAYY